MKLLLPVTLLFVGALAKSCTPYEAYELNDCLDVAFEKVHNSQMEKQRLARISSLSD